MSKINKKIDIRVPLIIIAITSFILAVFSLSQIQILEMGTERFFFQSVVPFPFWISIFVLLACLVYSFYLFDNSKNILLTVLFSILLMSIIRSAFPLMFSSVIAYEPDTSRYITTVSDWLRSSIDLGISGNYQHDYPLSFLIAYSFGKLGVPLEIFYRFSPLFIYAIELVLFYLIIIKITDNPKVASIGTFLMAISPLNYWLSVHFCPDLIGSLFFLLTLYLVINLAKSETIRLSRLIPILISGFMIIISHHLGTLYFIVTMLGLAFSIYYFNSSLKGKHNYFLLTGIYIYTLWFAYGSFVYPEFFNIYSYFGQSGSAIELASEANLFENISFATYPVFILLLVLIYLNKEIGLKNILVKFLSPWLLVKRENISKSLTLLQVYTFGYSFVLALFFFGIAVPSIFAPRVLEILMVGLCPAGATGLIQLMTKNPSKKKKIVLYALLLLIILINIHRYYSQIQGRMLGSV